MMDELDVGLEDVICELPCEEQDYVRWLVFEYDEHCPWHNALNDDEAWRYHAETPYGKRGLVGAEILACMPDAQTFINPDGRIVPLVKHV